MDGANTGLCDSMGKPILIGDSVKIENTCNQEYHGDFAIYKVCLRGMIPILTYVESEKGKLLPEGYLATSLSEKYNQKLFLFTTDIKSLRPIEEMTVV